MHNILIGISDNNNSKCSQIGISLFIFRNLFILTVRIAVDLNNQSILWAIKIHDIAAYPMLFSEF